MKQKNLDFGSVRFSIGDEIRCIHAPDERFIVSPGVCVQGHSWDLVMPFQNQEQNVFTSIKDITKKLLKVNVLPDVDIWQMWEYKGKTLRTIYEEICEENKKNKQNKIDFGSVGLRIGDEIRFIHSSDERFVVTCGIGIPGDGGTFVKPFKKQEESVNYSLKGMTKRLLKVSVLPDVDIWQMWEYKGKNLRTIYEENKQNNFRNNPISDQSIFLVKKLKIIIFKISTYIRILSNDFFSSLKCILLPRNWERYRNRSKSWTKLIKPYKKFYPNENEIIKLEKLNQQLKKIERIVFDESCKQYVNCIERLNSKHWFEDFEIDVNIMYYIDKSDKYYNELQENIIWEYHFNGKIPGAEYFHTKNLNGGMIANNLDFNDKHNIIKKNKIMSSHCWFFHELTDYLNFLNVLRIKRIDFEFKIRLQSESIYCD